MFPLTSPKKLGRVGWHNFFFLLFFFFFQRKLDLLIFILQTCSFLLFLLISKLGLIRIFFSEIELNFFYGRHEKLGSVWLVETNNFFLRLISQIKHVSGLHEAKEALTEAIVMPLQFPHLFTGEIRIHVPYSFLLTLSP